MFANIEPLKIVPGTNVAVILELLAIVVPNKGARVEWRLLNSQTQVVANGLDEMSSDDYAKWGDDDSYLFTWIAPRLGVTIKELTEPAPPPVHESEPVPDVPGIEE